MTRLTLTKVVPPFRNLGNLLIFSRVESKTTRSDLCESSQDSLYPRESRVFFLRVLNSRSCRIDLVEGLYTGSRPLRVPSQGRRLSPRLLLVDGVSPHS